MNKFIIKYFMILLILLIFINTGCLNNNKEYDKYYSYSFELSLFPSNDGDFNVTIPILVHQNGSISDVMNNLFISKGKGSYEIIYSDFGYALNIKSNSEIILISKLDKTKGDTKIVWDILSLEKNTTYDGEVDVSDNNLNFYVYFNNNTSVEQINLSISYEANFNKGKSGYDTYSKCKGLISPLNKWQIIEGYRAMEAYG